MTYFEVFMIHCYYLKNNVYICETLIALRIKEYILYVFSLLGILYQR